MPHALGKAAAEHTDAKHQAAHKHDPAGPLPVRNQAADNHRDKAQRIGDREHDGQTGNIQLLCHRRGQHAPGIHGANAQVNETTDHQKDPPLFG